MNRRNLLLSAAVCLAAFPGWAQESAPAAAQPTADEIIQKFTDATGGTKAYEAVKTSVANGSFSIAAAGIKGAIKIYSESPDKAYAVVDIPGVGKMEEGSNGSIAWENSAIQGARIKTGDEAAAALREGAMDAHTNWKKYYKSAVVEGTGAVDGKDCYKVVMTPNQGAPETVYFEKASGLLVRQTSVYDTPMGKVPADIAFSDYRKQGSLLQPFHINQKVAGQEFEITLDSVVYNAEIPAGRFDLPAEIKALQK